MLNQKVIGDLEVGIETRRGLIRDQGVKREREAGTGRGGAGVETESTIGDESKYILS